MALVCADCLFDPQWALKYTRDLAVAFLLVLYLDGDFILRLFLDSGLILLQEFLPTFLPFERVVPKPLLAGFLARQKVVEFFEGFLSPHLIIAADVIVGTDVLAYDRVLFDPRGGSDWIEHTRSRLERDWLDVGPFLHDGKFRVVDGYRVVFASRRPARLIDDFLSFYTVEVLWHIYQVLLFIGTS